jgi:Zn-dependent M28 family amino/carboxypeptidase
MNSTPKPKRSVMFLAVTAEESGLLGSAYFGEDPLVPYSEIVGGINIDALLPAPAAKDLIVIGYGASELEDLLKKAADKRGMYLRPDAEPEKGYFYRSDHISLAKKGVPMLYADSGVDLVEGGEEAGRALAEDYVANRYHKPSDEYSEDWNFEGILNTFNILTEVGADMAYTDIWPNWYEGNEFRALRDAQMATE